MTPEQFSAWLALMGTERGWHKKECARRLGASRQSMANWSKTGPPLYIALAITALMTNLPPWPIEPGRKLDDSAGG